MGDYHTTELKIALDPNDPRHILPPRLPAALKILDVGCGAGQSLIAAYPERLSYGIDIDPHALQLGKRMSDRICFVNGRAEALPFKNKSFDFVLARISLPYTNVPMAVSEIHRVLNEGGRVWLTLHPFAIIWKQAMSSNYRGKLWFVYIVINSLLFHFFQHQVSFLGRYESFQTEHAITRCLARNGFTDIRVTRAHHFLVTARVT